MSDLREHFGLVLVTPPAVEPLTVADGSATDVKLWLRIDSGDTSQDVLLGALVKAARQRCERVTRRALVTQTWRYALDRFPGWPLPDTVPQGSAEAWGSDLYRFGIDVDPRAIRLPRPPLQSVTSVAYTDTTGTPQTLASDGSAYQVDSDSDPARLLPAYGTYWPITRPMFGAVKVTYVAGYGGTAASVPEELRAALMAHVGYCWREREAPDEEFLDSLFLPFAVGGLGG